MTLQFAPFTSNVQPAFWHALTTKKIDQYQLDDSKRKCHGFYAPGTAGLPTRLTLEADALTSDANASRRNQIIMHGEVLNTNTIEDFKKLDKNTLFKETSEKIWSAIESGQALEDSSLLNRFLLVLFADLKTYKFYHWFAFPAFQSLSKPWKLSSNPRPLSHSWLESEIKELRSKVSFQSPFFLVEKRNDGIDIAAIKDFDPSRKWILAFIDPSTLPTNPGWPLRNFLLLLQTKFKITKAKVLCYREQPGESDRQSSSIIIDIEVDPVTEVIAPPAAVGWERNSQSKLAPKMADLAPMLDPKRLADTAVDLNLKLMRWRIVPNLDLERIKQTKVLLLGAGTLGCYVSRVLLGWGVRTITFVDNAKVSFSNPVRQPLFDFEDCLQGGKPKAQAAASSLEQIYPGVNSRGITLSIPMPGHPLEDDEQGKKAIEQLEELIDQHDVVYLLMDSRESRWLPTVIGAAKNKLVMNAALGFDSFVVMRHGFRQTSGNANFSPHLGCYFCNDVVAPADSLSDRTLDQMCTVTRPGLAAIASANLVELMVSVLQHPLGPLAASETNTDDAEKSILGIVPHQIRGFLGRFQNMLITGQAYDKCTACSNTIVRAYMDQGFDFLKRAFNEIGFLENLTGLSQLHQRTDDLEAYEWDEDDE